MAHVRYRDAYASLRRRSLDRCFCYSLRGHYPHRFEGSAPGGVGRYLSRLSRQPPWVVDSNDATACAGVLRGRALGFYAATAGSPTLMTLCRRDWAVNANSLNCWLEYPRYS